jgi:hypothetical protein
MDLFPGRQFNIFCFFSFTRFSSCIGFKPFAIAANKPPTIITRTMAKLIGICITVFIDSHYAVFNLFNLLLILF